MKKNHFYYNVLRFDMSGEMGRRFTMVTLVALIVPFQRPSFASVTGPSRSQSLSTSPQTMKLPLPAIVPGRNGFVQAPVKGLDLPPVSLVQIRIGQLDQTRLLEPLQLGIGKLGNRAAPGTDHVIVVVP